jgi:hypothetical protein
VSLVDHWCYVLHRTMHPSSPGEFGRTGPESPTRQFHQVAVIVDARLKGGSIAESWRGTHMSGGLSHCRPLIIVDQVPPESIRAAAQDIACRAPKVHVLAVGACAIN